MRLKVHLPTGGVAISTLTPTPTGEMTIDWRLRPGRARERTQAFGRWASAAVQTREPPTGLA